MKTMILKSMNKEALKPHDLISNTSTKLSPKSEDRDRLK